MGRNWNQAPTEQGQYYLPRRAPAWMSPWTSAIAPRYIWGPLSCAHTLCSEWTRAHRNDKLASPHLLFFSPSYSLRWKEMVQQKSRVIFNFCRQVIGSLLNCVREHTVLLWFPLCMNAYSSSALASLMAIWFSFGHSHICPRDLENGLHLEALKPSSCDWSMKGKSRCSTPWILTSGWTNPASPGI